MKLYKKYTAKPNYFLVDDTALALDSPLRFRHIFFRKNIKSN